MNQQILDVFYQEIHLLGVVILLLDVVTLLFVLVNGVWYHDRIYVFLGHLHALV